MSRKGSGTNSNIADDDWDEEQAAALCDPLADWDFDSASAAKATAPSGGGSSANRYSESDQRAADDDLSTLEQWDTEFASHPGPKVAPRQGQQSMRPVQHQRPPPQQMPGSYQQFPPPNQQNHMMPYPGNGRTNRPSANPPVQGRPMYAPQQQPARPQQMQQQPPQMNPQMRPVQQPNGQYRIPHQTSIQQQQMRPPQMQQPMQMQPPQFRGQPNYPPQQRPTAQPNQMGRGRANFLPQSEYNNGSYHRPQGY